MLALICRAALAVLLLAPLACKRSESSDGAARPAKAVGKLPDVPIDAAVTEWLVDVSKKHGLDVRLDRGWALFPPSGARMSAVVIDGKPSGNLTILEVDFRALTPTGALLNQQVAGWGKDRDAAIDAAKASFLLGSYHAFLGAFVDPEEEHVHFERRTVGGKPRIVTFGDVVMKSMGEKPVVDDGRWKTQVLTVVDALNLSPGIHWVDVYNGTIGNKQELEVQVDNVRDASFEDAVRAAPWPYNGTFTSVRLLLILQDPEDPTRPRATAHTTRPATTSPTSSKS